MTENLYSRIRGDGDHLLVLHGLFGSSDNLGWVASELAQDYTSHAIDLRNHGRSFHHEQMDYRVMAEDVVAYMDAHDIAEAVVLGHSMGGKVAMTLALHFPERVKALLVADISPVTYEGGRHREIFAGLFSLHEANISSRAEADRYLSEHVAEAGIRQFLLKNLKPISGGGFELKLNLPAIKSGYEEIMSGQKADLPYQGKVLFIAGADSDYIQADHKDHTLALFPKATMKIIPGASHWLHAEKPEVFLGICQRFLNTI